jgi:hypothetical protein
MVQDVAHARAGGESIAKLMQEKGWALTGPPEIYPTGTTDFSLWGFTAGYNSITGATRSFPRWIREKGAVGTIFQWQSGKRVAVYPFSIAAGEVRLPPGLTRR